MCLIADHSAPESADSTRDNFLQIFERKMEERHRQLRESGKHLIKSFYINVATRVLTIFLSGSLLIHLL